LKGKGATLGNLKQASCLFEQALRTQVRFTSLEKVS
jgi:hypothetical protein